MYFLCYFIHSIVQYQYPVRGRLEKDLSFFHHWAYMVSENAPKLRFVYVGTMKDMKQCIILDIRDLSVLHMDQSMSVIVDMLVNQRQDEIISNRLG